jgi:hypothetical protein
MRSLLLAGLTVVLSLSVGADALADATRTGFDTANGHYAGRRWSDAAAQYNELIEHGVHNAEVYYNLGNTYFQQKRYGWAILSYKRAFAIAESPDLKDTIRHNVDLTRDAIIRRKSEESTSVAVLDETHGALYSVFHLISTNLSASLFGFFWVLLFAVLVVRRLGPNEQLGPALRVATVPLIVLTLVTGTLFGGNVLTTRSTVRGIVVDRNVKLKQGSVERDLTEGLEVQILDDSDTNESLIRLSNGWKGRVPSRAVERI